MNISRTPSSFTDPTTSYGYGCTTTGSQLTRARAQSRMSRRTAPSSIGGGDQEIVCAISEARGVMPTIGIAFVNLSTSEAVISQVCDNAFYTKTINKIQVFEPSQILIMSTQTTSKMASMVEDNCDCSNLIIADRKYWTESAGIDYIDKLAFKEDIEALKFSIGGNYYATCCLGAALKYIDTELGLSFSRNSLRMRFQPSEGTMMIDLATIQSLELVQNSHDSKSKDNLFGVINATRTPMGSRCLRSNILQPSTDRSVLEARYDAVQELATTEDMFFSTQQALKNFSDVDKLLTTLVLNPCGTDVRYAECSINNVLLLKGFVQAAGPVYHTLMTAQSALLRQVAGNCHPNRIQMFNDMVNNVINGDVAFAKSPLELRTNRTYAVKSGVNGLLDVARQTFKETTADVHSYVSQLNEAHDVHVDIAFDESRRYYFKISTLAKLDDELLEIFINRVKKKDRIECQTLHLVKLNQRLEDSHQEVVLMSDKIIQTLLDDVRDKISTLFRACEAIAMLDMLASFAILVVDRNYVRPNLGTEFVIKQARHPITEKTHRGKFVPNDFYATQQSRFQIVTGCNMSGKSTYIRTLALLSVLAQIGCFIPADYAWVTIIHQLFARMSIDDSITANVSTFVAEMRETAYILRNVDSRSIAIIDELGRGTSSRDGLAIAIAIAEALIDSHAYVWFATHFRQLAEIMNDRNGVVNMHLAVMMPQPSQMTMLYKRTDGFVLESHYGIALAKTIDLPPKVIEVAEKVSHMLEERRESNRRSSEAVAVQKRRKLVLGLRETLMQAINGPMNGTILLSWLRKVQTTFVLNMEAIDTAMGANGKGEDKVSAVTCGHSQQGESSG